MTVYQYFLIYLSVLHLSFYISKGSGTPITAAENGCKVPATPYNGNFEVEGCEGERADPFYPPCWKDLNFRYPVGQVVKYFCYPKYTLRGAVNVKCLQNGTWSEPFPKCCKRKIQNSLPSETTTTGEDSSSEESMSAKNIVSLKVFEEAEVRKFDLRSEDSVSCPPLIAANNVEFECLTQDGRINNCDHPPLPPYTVAHLKCSKYYKSAGELAYRYRKCKPDGTWSTEGSISCISDCGKSDSPRTPLITNGSPSVRGQFPWHAALYSRENGGSWGYICGGSLISQFVILTAGHCVTSQSTETPLDVNKLTVVLGKFNRLFDVKETNTQQGYVKKIIVHPSYSSLNFDSDIALIVLKAPMEFTFYVRPICFPESFNSLIEEYQIQEGNVGTVAGWGVMETGKLAPTLLTANLPVVSSKTCIESYKEFFENQARYTNFCAGYTNGTAVCNGDSGGGMIFPSGSGTSQRWYIQGIVSVGAPDPEMKLSCDSHQYTLFTRVGRYSDWMVRTLSPDGYI